MSSSSNPSNAPSDHTKLSTSLSAAGKRKRLPWELKGLKSVDLDQMVGSGTFGLVFKASERDTGETVALKKIKIEPTSNQGFPVTAIREIRILKSLKHENIVALKEIIVYKPDDDDEETKKNEVFESGGLTIGDIFMVFEYCFCDLSGLLKTKEVEITEGHIKSYMKQLLSGLHYLHIKKILHRDIKSANILVTRNNVIKIADWGLARTYYDTTKQVMTNPVVTLWYRSPELLLGSKHYGSEVDIWSVGCVFCEMKERIAPLRAENETNQLEKIYELCGYPSVPPLLDKYKSYPDWEKYAAVSTPPHANVTPRLRHRYSRYGADDLNLLEKMLDIDPATRITADQALDENYFWTERTPAPHELKSFDGILSENMTEHLVQKKHREDVQKAKEADKALQEKKREDAIKHQRDHHHHHHGAHSSRGGRFGGRNLPAATKYKVLENPTATADSQPPPPPP